jgi:putative endonuclease
MRLAFRNKARHGSVETAGINSDSPAVAPHFELGRRGEAMALSELQRAGYRIVAANFSVPVGRNIRNAVVKAEIDIVAYDGPTLCFIEVKTRASDEFAPPQANVDLRKRRQIARAARAYRRMMGLMNSPYRYDVVSVLIPVADSAKSAGEPRAELLKRFWTDEQLRPRRRYEPYWD